MSTTAASFRLTFECQTCGTRYDCVWPAVHRCPACAAKHPGPPRRLSEDAYGNGRYGALPGDAATIVRGHVTDAMIFEQVAWVRAREAASCGARSAA